MGSRIQSSAASHLRQRLHSWLESSRAGASAGGPGQTPRAPLAPLLQSSWLRGCQPRAAALILSFCPSLISTLGSTMEAQLFLAGCVAPRPAAAHPRQTVTRGSYQQSGECSWGPLSTPCPPEPALTHGAETQPSVPARQAHSLLTTTRLCRWLVSFKGSAGKARRAQSPLACPRLFGFPGSECGEKTCSRGGGDRQDREVPTWAEVSVMKGLSPRKARTST